MISSHEWYKKIQGLLHSLVRRHYFDLLPRRFDNYANAKKIIYDKDNLKLFHLYTLDTLKNEVNNHCGCSSVPFFPHHRFVLELETDFTDS